MENQFLVSVADAYIYDAETNGLIVRGKALLNSGIEESVQNQEINAGKGSGLIYEFNFAKALNFTIESATFDTAYICLQNGTGISRELAEYHREEILTFDEYGKATLQATPSGKVQVEMPNGVFNQVTPTGKEITVAELKGKESTVVYIESKELDTITISAEKFPKAVKLVLNADINTNAGKIAELQITVPRFKPDGALNLSMAHDAVNSSALNGKALKDNKNNLSYFHIVPTEDGAGNVGITRLVASPSTIELSASETGDSAVLNVIGIRGGQYSNITLDNADLTFTSDDETVATVDATGTVTLAVGATADTHTIIHITDGTYKDIVAVYVL